MIENVLFMFTIDKKNCFLILLGIVTSITVSLVIYADFSKPAIYATSLNTADRNSSLHQILDWQLSKGKRGYGFGSGLTLMRNDISNIEIEDEKECKNYRFLVYKCDTSSLCGGLGDREKGIITSFLLSYLSNRTFVIRVTDPCELSSFVKPNMYNWNKCGRYLRTIQKKDITEYNFFFDYGRSLKRMLRENFDFDSQWTKQVVIVRITAVIIDTIRLHKHATSRLSWLLKTTNEDAVHLILHSLFRPKERLSNTIRNFFQKTVRRKRLVCCHIRKGRNPTIPNDALRREKTPNERVIFQFLKKYDMNNESVIYVASDSDDVRNQAKTTLSSYINFNRTIVHVDRFKREKKCTRESYEGFFTVILEQLILSECDVLVLTHSGFGSLAAFMRGISKELYYYHPRMETVLKLNLTSIRAVMRYF